MEFFQGYLGVSEWWRALNGREQFLVACAGIFVIGAATFLFVLEPLAKEQKMLNGRLEAERDSFSRTQQYAKEANLIRERMTDSAMQAIDRSQSFLSILNQTSSEHRLQSDVKRIVPNGVDKASVVFDTVAFDLLAAWLVDLQTKNHVSVARITVDKTKQSGIVRANVNLVR